MPFISNYHSNISNCCQPQNEGSTNIFDNLPMLARPAHHCDELTLYLSTDIIEDVDNAIQSWYVHQSTYPQPSRIAINSLPVPGKCKAQSVHLGLLSVLVTSVQIERPYSVVIGFLFLIYGNIYRSNNTCIVVPWRIELVGTCGGQ